VDLASTFSGYINTSMSSLTIVTLIELINEIKVDLMQTLIHKTTKITGKGKHGAQ